MDWRATFAVSSTTGKAPLRHASITPRRMPTSISRSARESRTSFVWWAKLEREKSPSVRTAKAQIYIFRTFSIITFLPFLHMSSEKMAFWCCLCADEVKSRKKILFMEMKGKSFSLDYFLVLEPFLAEWWCIIGHDVPGIRTLRK